MPYKDPKKQREAAKRWVQSHPEQIRAANNRRRAAKRAIDPEGVRAARHTRYVRHKEKELASGRAWRAAHPEQVLALIRSRDKIASKISCSNWSKNNREKTRIFNARRVARKRSMPDTFTCEEQKYMLQYWGYSCAVCGNEEGFQWTLANDHWIPLSSPECPGTIACNIVPLCHGVGGCNNSKKAKNALAWLLNRFGKRKALIIEKSILAYFSIVQLRQTQES